MKVFSFFLFSALAIVSFSAAATAQDKNLTPLAENASLEETQKWLVKAIDKNNSFKVKGTKNITKNEILDIKFDGCQLSYRIMQETMIENSTLPQISSMDKGTAGGQPENILRSALVVSFDLKDIDPARINLKPISTTDTIETIWFETTGAKNIINLKSNPGTQQAQAGTQSTIYMNVKKTASNPIKAGLVHAVNLCQKPN